MNSEVRKQIVVNALRADSLAQLLERQNLYIMNIQDVIKGEVKLDSVHSIDSLTIQRSEELMGRTQNEEAFRNEYEEREKYNLSNSKRSNAINDAIFYRPTRGLLSANFDPQNKHFGVDIAASPNESILATLDGTVIFSGYTSETGYVIQLQHVGNLVSIYKHCGSLLKTMGDKVKAGEVIALVGNTGQLSTGPHLHFELWHRGQPLNPQQYIEF